MCKSFDLEGTRRIIHDLRHSWMMKSRTRYNHIYVMHTHNMRGGYAHDVFDSNPFNDLVTHSEIGLTLGLDIAYLAMLRSIDRRNY